MRKLRAFLVALLEEALFWWRLEGMVLSDARFALARLRWRLGGSICAACQCRVAGEGVLFGATAGWKLKAWFTHNNQRCRAIIWAQTGDIVKQMAQEAGIVKGAASDGD